MAKTSSERTRSRSEHSRASRKLDPAAGTLDTPRDFSFSHFSHSRRALHDAHACDVSNLAAAITKPPTHLEQIKVPIRRHMRVRLEFSPATANGESAVVLDQVVLGITVGDMKALAARHFRVRSVTTPDLSSELDDALLEPLLIDGECLRIAFAKGSSPKRTRPLAGGGADPARIRDPAPRGTLALRTALKDATPVLPGQLFVGGQQSSRSLAALRELGVTHVLNLCDRVKNKFTRAIAYRTLSISDSKSVSISGCFAEAFAFIDDSLEGGGACLVHCLVGASRSVSVVLAYVIARRGVRLRDAFLQLRARRLAAMPNTAFRAQLIAFERVVRASRIDAAAAAASDTEEHGDAEATGWTEGGGVTADGAGPTGEAADGDAFGGEKEAQLAQLRDVPTAAVDELSLQSPDDFASLAQLARASRR